ncbi:MAG TPA: 30S ribosomal protein S9, partial [Candidatus Saccharicenans sp.]|nr:30S ribosomal protein S9 [Candidatus Saccharicenans sp.]
MSLIQYYGTGKRKNAIARVFLRSGKGDITLVVNKKIHPYEEYFKVESLRILINQPLVLTETDKKFDIF